MTGSGLKGDHSEAEMWKGTLGQALERTEPEAVVYIVRRKAKDARPLYVGSTTKSVGWRLRRHVRDGGRQEHSTLSPVLRRCWPCDGVWIETMTPGDVARVTSTHRSLSLRAAESIMLRRLRPILNSVDGDRPGLGPEQTSLWQLPPTTEGVGR